MPDSDAPSLEALLEWITKGGKLEDLSPNDKARYYNWRCAQVGLDPRDEPFEWMQQPYRVKVGNDWGWRDRWVLYLTAHGAGLLRQLQKIDIFQLDRTFEEGWVFVTAHGRHPDGREDCEEGGARTVDKTGQLLPPKGQENAYHMAVTRAKRRLTLSLARVVGVEDQTDDEPPGATVEGAQGPLAEPDGPILGEVRAQELDTLCQDGPMTLAELCKELGVPTIGSLDPARYNEARLVLTNATAAALWGRCKDLALEVDVGDETASAKRLAVQMAEFGITPPPWTLEDLGDQPAAVWIAALEKIGARLHKKLDQQADLTPPE